MVSGFQTAPGSVSGKLNIVFVVHYFPPVNSSGARRVEALSKYMAADGHRVTVLTTRKTSKDGQLSERPPAGVTLIEIDRLGRERSSRETAERYEPMFTANRSWKRRVVDFVMEVCGQLPDPRLPFALSFAMPWFSPRAAAALREADVVIGSTPPWPSLLAVVIAKRRFGVPCVFDYRDLFSGCHAMPGSPPAKWLERVVDRWLNRRADRVVGISEPLSEYLRMLGGRVSTILNGYDHEVMEEVRVSARPHGSDATVIRFMGSVLPDSVPHNLLSALVALRAAGPVAYQRLRFEFYGNTKLIEEAVATRYPEVADRFVYRDFVPYREAVRLMMEADYLLFAETSVKTSLSAQGVYSTKLFEYIGSGRPVLADISPDTIAGALLCRSGPQHIVSCDAAELQRVLAADEFHQRRPDGDPAATRQVSRRAQATTYLALLSGVVAERGRTP